MTTSEINNKLETATHEINNGWFSRYQGNEPDWQCTTEADGNPYGERVRLSDAQEETYYEGLETAEAGVTVERTCHGTSVRVGDITLDYTEELQDAVAEVVDAVVGILYDTPAAADEDDIRSAVEAWMSEVSIASAYLDRERDFGNEWSLRLFADDADALAYDLWTDGDLQRLEDCGTVERIDITDRERITDLIAESLAGYIGTQNCTQVTYQA